MRHPDYSHVILSAKGKDKPQALPLQEALASTRRPGQRYDCHLSIARYTPDLQAHVNGNGRLKGYDGPVYCDYLGFDLDRGDAGHRLALGDARQLAMTLHEQYGLREDQVRYFFSGSKGYHLLVPMLLAGEVGPSPLLPPILRRMAADGTHMIDRAVQVARALARREIGSQISADDRLRIMRVADEWFKPSAKRYRFEVWGCAFVAAVRRTIAYHSARGAAPEELQEATGGSAVVEIAARWMEKWPYGGGSDEKTGRRRYVEYREVLKQAGLLESATPYVHQAYRYRNVGQPSPDVLPPNRATGYRVVLPTGGPPAVPVDPKAVRARCRAWRRGGTALTVDEAYHALYLAHADEKLTKRYGRRTRELVQQISDMLRLAQ